MRVTVAANVIKSSIDELSKRGIKVEVQKYTVQVKNVYLVVNEQTNQIQSSWSSATLAKRAAKDLNQVK